MHIAFAASEFAPLVKSGGLGEVMGALPPALAQLGHSVSVFLPYYRCLREQNTSQKPPVLAQVRVQQGHATHHGAILDGGRRDGVQLYLVDHAEFFDRETLYGGAQGAYPDNGLRFGFFCGAMVEAVRVLGVPDVFHAQHWQTALLPVLLRTTYAGDASLQSVPTVFTVHNAGYQGDFPRELLTALSLPETLFSPDRMEHEGKVNFFKGALVFADALTTVSPHHAEELQTEEYGGGLHANFQARAGSFTGILNGVDYSEWDPARDPCLATHYSAADLSGKIEGRRALLNELEVTHATDQTAVLVMVSRLASQKGFDLLAEVIPDLLREDVLLAIMGTGEERYETMLRELAEQYPEKLRVLLEFDDTMAHRMVAGADISLMPSRYEPSGLAQMYSLRYGTVPVVRATGGLDDTVHEGADGDGFRFAEYRAEPFLKAIRRALGSFQDKPAWQEMMRRGMALEYSWDQPAREYVAVYEQAIQARLKR